MLRELNVKRFKGFESFSLNFSERGTFVVGPNSAGKTTLVTAVRAASSFLRIAASRTPNVVRWIPGDRQVLAYTFSDAGVGLDPANIRHEFRHHLTTSFTLTFADGSVIGAVWPPDAPGANDLDEGGDPSSAFFYLLGGDGRQPRRPQEVRELFAPIGVIPILSPLDREEGMLTDKYLKANVDSRLASRHFRNQLALLSSRDFDRFWEFASPWLPEFDSLEMGAHLGQQGLERDVYYREPGSRFPKELFWAGDGLQVWIQMLYHAYRLRETDVVVLDEPDLYLHADLQRRLVRLLEDELSGQTIAATHSPEVLVEAEPTAIAWVDKSRSRSVRGREASVLADVAAAIGSSFNLRIAKALKSQVVVFVEGQDMKILRLLAERLGARRVAREMRIAIFPLEGYANWENVLPFQWMIKEVLADSVETFVFLDRDYRTDMAVDAVESRLRALGIHGHVWLRKELESYLIEYPVLARVSGAPESFLRAACDEILTRLRSMVFSRQLDEFGKSAPPGQSRVTTTDQFMPIFEERWSDPVVRSHISPPKDLVHSLNSRLRDAGFSTVSPRSLARHIERDEIDAELQARLLAVEEAAT